MANKKETKKRHWERWKAKPIIDIKNQDLESKVEIVEELEKELPEWNDNLNSNWSKKAISESVLQKLKLCFAVWMTDKQACYFCWISERSLYYYQEKNPDFLQEKEILKESVTMQARVNIWRSIKSWNVWDSWKRVTLRDPAFTPKLNVWWEVKTTITKEQKEKEQKLLNKMKGFLWV